MALFYITGNNTGARGNGITGQALTWAQILGDYTPIQVTLVNSWQSYDYQKGDIVHLFGSGGVWFHDVAKQLKEKECKVVWSPICDNIDSPNIQRMKAYMGSKRLQLFSYPMIRRLAYNLMDRVFVRSNYEKEYIKKAYGVNERIIDVIPLSMSYNNLDTIDTVHREKICLHISSIYQERKNVLRLIKAAKKYNFRLLLAGDKGSVSQFEPLEKEIEGNRNIEVLGYISEEQKVDLYKRAKVFALPSIKEGVGIVALDAAHFGCEIVITNIGGSKEYYADMAHQVNPLDVDSIGKAVIHAMGSGNGFQPKLSERVNKMYSQQSIANDLYIAYNRIIEKK